MEVLEKLWPINVEEQLIFQILQHLWINKSILEENTLYLEEIDFRWFPYDSLVELFIDKELMTDNIYEILIWDTGKTYKNRLVQLLNDFQKIDQQVVSSKQDVDRLLH